GCTRPSGTPPPLGRRPRRARRPRRSPGHRPRTALARPACGPRRLGSLRVRTRQSHTIRRPMPVTVVDHPLAQHLLTGLRDQDTPPPVFRTLAKRLTLVLVVEAVRGL